MDFKRILVALNSPNGRDAAFDRGLGLARTFGAELYLLHAVPLTDRFSAGARERLARTAELRRRAEAAGVRVLAVEQSGDPAEIIELHAHARAADLIVMGGAPRRGWNERSPIAERIIRSTDVPTLVVASSHPPPRPSNRARYGADQAFRHVLAAIDLSPLSQQVVDAAVALTAGEIEHLTVVHAASALQAVDGLEIHAPWAAPEYRRQVLDGTRRELAGLLTGVPQGLDTSVHVRTAPAARAILDRAAALHADLVVVGRGPGFSLFGSTALRVFRKLERPLLVVPSTAASGGVRAGGQLAA